MRKDLIEHKKWLSRTSVMGRFRSPELKKLDAALQAYETSGSENDLKLIRTTLAAWKQKELKLGHAWEKSARNKDGAFTELGVRLDAQPVSNFYTQDLAHTRLGVLYLFSAMDVESGIFDIIIDSGANFVGNVIGAGGALTPSDTGAAVATALGTVVSGAQTLRAEYLVDVKPPAGKNAKLNGMLEKIKEHLVSFAKNIWAHLTAMFKKDATKSWIDFAGDWWTRITGVINLVLNQIGVSAAPFVGAAFDIVQGSARTVKACYDRYVTYALSKGVDMNDGHPAVVVKSIERTMNLAIGSGLYQALRGAAATGANAASAGAGAILSMVVAGCELIAKFVYRLWESSKMKAFFEDCKDRYSKFKTAQKIADDDVMHSGVAFGAWYRAAAYTLPCLSAIALCSGLTGDKMMYLSMFKDQKDLAPVKPGGYVNPIAQSEFDRGVSYIDNLKEAAKGYIKDSGYKFTSTDKMVSGIISSQLFAA